MFLYSLAGKFPIKYDNKVEELKSSKVPSIVDIGCGYGGLLFELSREFRDELVLGMEIRDKVTNYVVQKVNSMRINS
jgi:tRNA (guanine-N7-)-methyltransferase